MITVQDILLQPKAQPTWMDAAIQLMEIEMCFQSSQEKSNQHQHNDFCRAILAHHPRLGLRSAHFGYVSRRGMMPFSQPT
jgi:hypothetical protein